MNDAAISNLNYVPVATLDELGDDEGTCVHVNDQQLALFKDEEGEVYAVGNICPHQGAPLADGWFDAEEGTVTCPLHAWDFDVRTGRRTNGPESVPSYKVRVVGDTIEVLLSE
jgi:NAD(P)H-dependent nitrite reductase small subunit